MPISNYTTKIAASKTVGEIMELLARHGADKIMTDYEGGIPVALSFAITTPKGMIHFQLPANWKGVQSSLERQNVPKAFRGKDQAVRVSWRILRDWVEAQMAMVEAEVAAVEQVFLSYALLKDGTTVCEAAISNDVLQLKK